MKKTFVLAYLVCFGICSLFADNEDLLAGLNAYTRGDWGAATESLEQALTTAEQSERTEAFYWLVMSEGSAHNYERAVAYADAFLEAAPEDERAAEVCYQKGRMLHLSGEYLTSSKTFYQFIATYPTHPKIPSAYYWIGENFYSVGNFDEARKIFSQVVVQYPQSGKVSEARYKIVLIDQRSVRDELSRMASAARTAPAQAEQTSEPVAPEAKAKPDAAPSAVVTDTAVKADTAPSAVVVDKTAKPDPAAVAPDRSVEAEPDRANRSAGSDGASSGKNDVSAASAVAPDTTAKADAATSAAQTAAAPVEKASESVAPEAESKPDAAERAVIAANTAKPTAAAVASDSGKEAQPVTNTSPLVEEQKQPDYVANRLTSVEEKIDEMSAALSLIEEAQGSRRIQEQQQSFEQQRSSDYQASYEQQQKAAQLQKEQEEAERQQLEKRRWELAELKARTKTLKRLYEQYIKGAK